MAGHSKWATTKRHKAAVDAKRGKIFSVISKDLTLAARSGGGDSEFNPRLRALVLKAKQVNMPADNIDRAIKKGTGEIPGQIIEEIVYEGYAPGGIGVMVECTTDNKNRSVSEVRSTFSKFGGNLASEGAVAHNFQYWGQFLIESEKSSEEKLWEVTLNAGAEDIKNHGDHFEVLCPVSEFYKISNALADHHIECTEAERVYLPNVPVPIHEKEVLEKVLRLIDRLEELEDVKTVHANFKVDESLLND